MKDPSNSAAVGRAPEAPDAAPRPAADAAPADASFANRKLIRPSLRDFDQEARSDRRPPQRSFRPAFAGEVPATPRMHGESSAAPAAPRRDTAQQQRAVGGKRPTPPEQTHAENFYYQKQMQSKTMMTVMLTDGEKVDGVIEWYDRTCIKLTREGGTNVLVYKSAIKYMHKQE